MIENTVYYKALIRIELGKREPALTQLQAALTYPPEGEAIQEFLDIVDCVEPDEFQRYGLDTSSLVADHFPLDEPLVDNFEEAWL